MVKGLDGRIDSLSQRFEEREKILQNAISNEEGRLALAEVMANPIQGLLYNTIGRQRLLVDPLPQYINIPNYSTRGEVTLQHEKYNKVADELTELLVEKPKPLFKSEHMNIINHCNVPITFKYGDENITLESGEIFPFNGFDTEKLEDIQSLLKLDLVTLYDDEDEEQIIPRDLIKNRDNAENTVIDGGFFKRLDFDKGFD